MKADKSSDTFVTPIEENIWSKFIFVNYEKCFYKVELSWNKHV